MGGAHLPRQGDGEGLQRFVFDKPYSSLFACVDTNELKKFDRILIKDRHVPEEEGESAEGEEE